MHLVFGTDGLSNTIGKYENEMLLMYKDMVNINPKSAEFLKIY